MNEIEKAIEQLSTTKFITCKETEKAISLAISALEQQLNDRWIPVSERLPELGEIEIFRNVNATIKYPDGTLKTVPMTYERRGKDKKPTWCYLGRISTWDVTKWKPLPLPHNP